MAKVVTTTLVDDIDGSTAQGTTNFGLDGQPYEIDLSEENRKELEAALAGYIESARAVRGGSPKRQAKQSGRTERRADLSAIREWARGNGWPEVAGRGRVKGEIVTAYDAAH